MRRRRSHPEIGEGTPPWLMLDASGSCAVAPEGGDAGHDQKESAGDEAEPGNVGDDVERAVLVVADDSGDGEQCQGDACEQSERFASDHVIPPLVGMMACCSA